MSAFLDAHGVEIFYRGWPHEKPVGAVVIAHGASEHSERYDRFARALNDAGFAVYALDHRGHGHTSKATGVGRMGPPGGQALVDDIDQLLDLARTDHPDAHIVLFGHSMGALIGLAYATQRADRLAGTILCGFPAAPSTVSAVGDMFAAAPAELRDEPIDLLGPANETFEPARTPFDWLSRDDAEVDRYIADPFCGNAHPLTTGFVADMLDVVASALQPESLANISSPVLLIAGERDPAAAFGDNLKELAAALETANVSTDSKLYPDARHELLNETNREEVTADIISWMLNPAARP